MLGGGLAATARRGFRKTSTTTTQTRARRLFDELASRVEEFAEEPTATEAVLLYDKPRSGDETALMRMEYELQREVECWDAIRAAIEDRLVARREILEGNRAKRAAESKEG
jgi:hypothetical protein